MNGLITKLIGGLYFVEAENGVIFKCKARGIFRKMEISPQVGDYVLLEEINDDEAVIAKIFDRKNSLIRPQISNLDVIIFVTSTCKPAPNFTILDKFLAVAAFKNIEAVIAVTKNDIKKYPEISEIYKNANVKIFEIDYDNKNSYLELYDYIAGKIAVFTGNSGVGKSTLLNCIDKNITAKTAEISDKLGRGRHTTRHTELYKLENGGYIADTPGFSTFETNKYDIIRKEELEFCFPEFSSYLGKCKFQDCAHTKEKGCAVIAATEAGEIPKSRHENYIAMYEEAKLIKDWEIVK